MGKFTFGVFAVVAMLFIGPALVIFGFNTLNEQGQWALAYMPHNLYTYLAILCIGGLFKVTSK